MILSCCRVETHPEYPFPEHAKHWMMFLLDTVEHLTLKTVLQFSTTDHCVNYFVDGAFRVFLQTKIAALLSYCISLPINKAYFTHTCRMKSWITLFSETWHPIGKRFFSCCSIRTIVSWSSCVVKPSAPKHKEQYTVVNMIIACLC